MRISRGKKIKEKHTLFYFQNKAVQEKLEKLDIHLDKKSFNDGS